MSDFSAYTGWAIPEGVVTQVADAAGNVLWAVQNSAPIVLQVEKITADTYAGQTSYTGEQFILLDIYPTTNGTVKVTYGGLTKTITDTSGAAEPNAQQVFFGTFNGVSDSVTTPASGTLTIEGKCAAFGIGTFQNGAKTTSVGYCSCITAINEWGDVKSIPAYAFYECKKIVNCEMPDSILNIGQYSFYLCWNITNLKLSNSITVIPANAFADWVALRAVTIPASVTEIGETAFISIRSGADSLTVTMLSTTPPTLKLKVQDTNAGTTTDYPFNKAGKVNFIVPKGCGDIYKTANVWSVYANYITEAS